MLILNHLKISKAKSQQQTDQRVIRNRTRSAVPAFRAHHRTPADNKSHELRALFCLFKEGPSDVESSEQAETCPEK